MSVEFIDLNASTRNGSPSKPRGLLPVPPEVEQAVVLEKSRLQPFMNEEAERRTRDHLTLQYYYENSYIAYRSTSQGVEVLAVGLEEIGELVKRLSQDDLLHIHIGQP